MARLTRRIVSCELEPKILPSSCELRINDKPRRRMYAGHAVNGACTMGAVVRDGSPVGDPLRSIQVLSAAALDQFRPGCCGYVFAESTLPTGIQNYLADQKIPSL